MITLASIPTLASGTRDLVADQTEVGILDVLGTHTFDVTEGCGIATASSLRTVLLAGGFADFDATAIMKYVSPSTSGTEEFGLIACYENDSSGGTYYWVRVYRGEARLVRAVAGTFTTLASQAWVLPQDEAATLQLSRRSSQLTATFTAATPGSVQLAATDSTIGNGLFGFRTLSTAGYCSSLSWEQR